MQLHLNIATLQLLQTVRAATPPEIKIYLVGGAVRDSVLGRAVKDFDFVVPEKSRQIAQAVRKSLGGLSYTLDDERQTVRLIQNQGQADELILDFVCFVGATLVEDLRNRDFTLNTMAIDLDEPDQLLDLLDGQADLEDRCLRAASALSMELDPLRALRGARMLRAFGLHVEPQTFQWIQAAAPRLGQISGERVRDELFKLLALPDVWQSFVVLDDLGILTQVFPELKAVQAIPAHSPHVHPLWEHTLKVIAYLEVLLTAGTEQAAAPQNPHLQMALEALAPFGAQLRLHFAQALQGGRPREALFYLGALYHDVGKPGTQSVGADGRYHFYGHDQLGQSIAVERAAALMLGNAEVAYVSRLVGQHMRMHHLASPKVQLSDRILYRYFRDLGDVGVDLCLISLADTMAAFEETRAIDLWQREVDTAVSILRAWFARQAEVVKPHKLLDGNDIQANFGLEPGPLLGEVLAALEEAQAAGEIRDRRDAESFVAAFLADKQ